MTPCVNLGTETFLADERVVVRHAAVIVQAQDLAAQAARPLAGIITRCAKAHVQLAIGTECETCTSATLTVPGVGYQQLLDVGQLLAIEDRTREHGGNCLRLFGDLL